MEINEYRASAPEAEKLRDFSRTARISTSDRDWVIHFRKAQKRIPRSEFRFYSVLRETGTAEEAGNQAARNRALAREVIAELCDLPHTQKTKTKFVYAWPIFNFLGSADLLLGVFLLLSSALPQLLLAALIASILLFSKTSNRPLVWVCSGLSAFGALILSEVSRGHLSTDTSIIGMISALGALFVGGAMIGDFFGRYSRKNVFQQLAGFVLVALSLANLANNWHTYQVLLVALCVVSVSTVGKLLAQKTMHLGHLLVPSGFLVVVVYSILAQESPISRSSNQDIFAILGPATLTIFLLMATVFFADFAPDVRLLLLIFFPTVIFSSPVFYPSFLLAAAAFTLTFFAGSFVLELWKRGLFGLMKRGFGIEKN